MFLSRYGTYDPATNTLTEEPTGKVFCQEMDIPPTATEKPDLGWVFETAFSEDMTQKTSDEKLAEKAANAANNSPSGVVMVRSIIFDPVIKEEIATNPITVNKGDKAKVVLAKIKEAWQNAA